MGKTRKQKVIMIISLFVVIVSLSVGFAAFSTSLNISSSATVSPSTDDFTLGFYENDSAAAGSISYVEAIYKDDSVAEEIRLINGSKSLSGVTANFTTPGQMVTYQLLIKNTGKYTAYLNEISTSNASGGSSFKVCTPGSGTTASLVESACNGLNLEIVIDGLFFQTDTIINYGVSPGSSVTVQISISYASNASLADGPFSVSFAPITLDFSTVQNTSNLISFTIDGVEYQAVEGMTWLEWSESQYFIFDGMVSESSVMVGGGDMVTYSNGEFVAGTDVIIDGEIYYREIGNYPT